jgi:hypothetical protein
LRFKVKKSGTISSLFAILSLFTGDIEVPKTVNERAREQKNEQQLTSRIISPLSDEQNVPGNVEAIKTCGNQVETFSSHLNSEPSSDDGAERGSANVFEFSSHTKPSSVFPGLAASPLPESFAESPIYLEDESLKVLRKQLSGTALPQANVIARAATDSTLAVVSFYLTGGV